MMRDRVLIYVQCLIGTGHLHRATILSRALSNAGFDVTFVFGGIPVNPIRISTRKFIQLPPAKAEDTNYSHLVDQNGKRVNDLWKNKRRKALLEAFSLASPSVVIFETFPFGRQLLHFELLPLLAHIKRSSNRPLLISAVRDIIPRGHEENRGKRFEKLAYTHFDKILVHGDPRIIGLDESFPFLHRIRNKIVYTGYVVPPVQVSASKIEERDTVLISVGSGSVGYELLRNGIQARRWSCLKKYKWHFLAGNNLSDCNFNKIKAHESSGVIIDRFRADMANLLNRAIVSVSQAGNTMVEGVHAGASCVVVPWFTERETDQLARALAFAKCGLVKLIRPENLSPLVLAKTIDSAATEIINRKTDIICCDGASAVVTEITKAISSRRRIDHYKQTKNASLKHGS